MEAGFLQEKAVSAGVLTSMQTLLCLPKLAGQKLATGCCSQTSYFNVCET